MIRDRLIQFGSLGVAVAGMAIAGSMLPSIGEDAERHSLRYTDQNVDNAPPIVALGTAIGALRGLVVDYLWIRLNLMQNGGMYYDMLEDARLITKLQPRFPQVWIFHGHNMAYNVSVLTSTQEERWDWVKKGIDLVRNEGLRYNPEEVLLYKDLAFWLGHKVDGVSDDAHPYYKRQFAKEWHDLLGEPPADHAAMTEWIREIADAPKTLDAAIKRTPSVQTLIDRLRDEYARYAGEAEELALDAEFLRRVAWWESVTGQSWIADQLDAEKLLEDSDDTLFAAFGSLMDDAELDDAWATLLAHLRYRSLVDDYNMRPDKMYEYTRDLGPLDWRHPQAHALYFARLGSQLGQHRVKKDKVHHRINIDRQQLHSLQDLARSGRVTYDPYSAVMPGRFPEPRFIETIDDMFEELYIKYVDARGAGGETFMPFMENFMSSAIREAYRAGELDRARAIMDRLDSLFGSGASPPNHKYDGDLDVFVMEQTKGEYDRQPHIAPTDVVSSLRYAFRVGIGQRRPDVYKEAIGFANDVTNYFRTHESMDYETKLGTARMKDLLAVLGRSAEIAFLQVMTDPTISFDERAQIWAQVDEFEPEMRLRTSDRIRPIVARELAMSPLAATVDVDALLPEPLGIEAYRAALAERAVQEHQSVDDAKAVGVDRN
ncbi:MAG: hypothetical protein QF733_07225 [Phycisphaerales bacterium]|jgi:hypothetical protein|nr:hypothetical protein [Phycisphaerales bacterium]